MDKSRVMELKREILDLPETDRQQLAQELLPIFLTSCAGIESIDRVLRSLTDAELDAIVQRARNRSGEVSEEDVAAVIGEALRSVRAQRRS